MVQISISGGGKFESSEANVVQGLVVDTIGLIGILDQLVDREGGIVGFYNGIGNFWGGDD